MSSTDSLSTIIEGFQRLGDFPKYSSCIKSFGKSIIPPLLTRAQKQNILQLRSAAIKIESENVSKRNEYCSLSETVTGVIENEEQLPEFHNEDFGLYGEVVHYESTALHASKEMETYTSSTVDTNLSNIMHISISKSPSNDICTTVHKDVIVFPNVINPQEEIVGAHQTISTDRNSDDPSCQIPDSLITSEISIEQMSSVSEDEPDSISESAEFESLPTVINARRLVAQDTDNESNATCLSQSTDLEKYMDNSIDYSSPEDVITPSSQNISARSDDASSETIVNTENELTPCSSAMAQLTLDVIHCKVDENLVGADVVRRAKSVDSFVTMLKSTTNKMPIRKSQSEPSTTKFIIPTKIPNNKDGENTPIFDSDIRLAFGSEIDVKKSLKRKHIRSNSYTLDHPSPALVMAHADCDCSPDSPDSPPHSCLGHKIESTPNPAFKKEKINIVLPPMPERKKLFPVLSSVSFPLNMAAGDNKEISAVADGFVDTEIQMPEDVVLNFDKEMNVENLPLPSSIKQVQNSEENSNTESVEDNNEVVNANHGNPQTDTQENIQITTSAEIPDESNSANIEEILKEVIRGVKEIQKNRVNQFLKEQNKLWFKMQEEFQEQERLLCEKLNLVNMSSFTGGSHPLSYQFSDVNIKNCSVIENNPGMFQNNDSPHPNENSHIGDLTQNTTNNKPQEIDVTKELSNSNCVHSPFSNQAPNTTSPSNFPNCENFKDSVDSSQSNTSFRSLISTREDSGSSVQLIDNSSSLSVSTETSIQDHNRTASFQSNPCSKTLFKAKQFRNQTLDTLSDRFDSVSLKSQTSVDDLHFKGSEISKEESRNSSRCGLDMQSLHSNSLVTTDGSEIIHSSTTFRSSSNLSQFSDASKIYSESQFLNLNCPACATLGPSNNNGAFDRNYEVRRNDCQDCDVLLNNFCKHTFYDSSPDDGNSRYAMALSQVQPFSSQEESIASKSINSLLLPKNEDAITKMSFRNDKNNIPDFNLSDTSDSGAVEHSSSLNNNSRSHANSSQNTLVMNTKNIFSNVISEDKSYSEDEIRTINDLVQSSYTKSYSCQLNKDYCTALIATNDSTRNQTPLQQISPNCLKKENDTAASKKTISTSLTNLKRRQSRDIIKDPILLEKFARLPALVKGYLTRRLFKTERVQDLIKTLQDTGMLLGKLSQELNLKGNSVSESDVVLHKQLIVQLMTSFESVYDIFCTMSIKEQMKIISESRNFRMKKKAMEQKESAACAVSEKCTSSPNERAKPTAATLKAQERKRSSINSTTYTIEDFKSCKQRIHSSASSSKSHSISPSSIYKTSLGKSMKRKTASLRKTCPWK